MLTLTVGRDRESGVPDCALAAADGPKLANDRCVLSRTLHPSVGTHKASGACQPIAIQRPSAQWAKPVLRRGSCRSKALVGHHRHTLTGIGSEDRRSTGTLSLARDFINPSTAPNSISRRTETHWQEFRFPEGFAVPAFGGTEYHPPMPKLPATRPKRDPDADVTARRRASVEFRRKLKASGLSQAKLAAALGVQPSTVSSWATGAVMVPAYAIAYLDLFAELLAIRAAVGAAVERVRKAA
ncbi:helix-turn-helix transcriptional regulator [Azospirillum sp. Vi22]|nr:helix-turn-helix transcriptional regulator [Azospirillum baldaniorum]